MKLWYKSPATAWVEALPLGNGRFGAMVYGGVISDTFQLNDITLWSGSPDDGADRQDAHEYLAEIRRLIRAKDFGAAEQMIVEHFTGIKDDATYGSHVTMGDVNVAMHHASEFTDYRRTISLDDAVVTAEYSVGGVKYSREHFISAPAQTFVTRYTADADGAIGLTVSYDRQHTATVVDGSDIVVTGKADENGEMRFCVRIRVIQNGGSVAVGADGASLCVDGADEVLLLVASGTDYLPDASVGYKGGDPFDKVRATLDNLTVDYGKLKAEHIAEYRSYFGRLSLHIDGKSRDELSTDERLIALSQPDAEDDIGLVLTHFEFGRYLLISSSRPDNLLPANLQGLWNHHFKAPWEADYHSNINLQMNYWPAGPANLIECSDPLCRYVASLAENGRRTARAYYGSDGWMSGMNNNVFGHTSPGRGAPWGQFSVAGAWLCTHLYEYYAFTQDRAILDKFYPILRENVLFSLHTLIEDEDGYLVTSPSASPENTYITEDGHRGWVCEGATMDLEIIHETFVELLELGKICGEDESFLAEVEAADKRLRPLRIGAAGQLREWSGDWDLLAPEPTHRHVSHLFGLHPGTMITPEDTPDLIEAARKSLDLRGDDGTGWSLAWKINFRARLGDGDHAYKHIRRLLRFTESSVQKGGGKGGGTYTNLFDSHPPFQIDGNFGATAGICELLLQSFRRYGDTYVLYLLPALPTAFASGSVTGLCARGAHEVDMKWADSRLLSAKITSKAGKRCAVRGRYDVKDENGTSSDVKYIDGLTLFETVTGMSYILKPIE